MFKAARFKFFISARNQMSVCNVKGVTQSDRPTKRPVVPLCSTERFSAFQPFVLVSGLQTVAQCLLSIVRLQSWYYAVSSSKFSWFLLSGQNNSYNRIKCMLPPGLWGKPWRNTRMRLPSSCPPSTTSSQAFLKVLFKNTSCTQSNMLAVCPTEESPPSGGINTQFTELRST